MDVGILEVLFALAVLIFCFGVAAYGIYVLINAVLRAVWTHGYVGYWDVFWGMLGILAFWGLVSNREERR